MDWPHIVRLLRKTYQEKQYTFAQHLGVDQATVSRWENGRQVPASPYREVLLYLFEGASAPAEGGRPDLGSRAAEAFGSFMASAAFAAAPVALFLLDLDFRLVTVNARLSEIIGRATDGHAGRRLSEVLGEMGTRLEAWLPGVVASGVGADVIELAGMSPVGSGRRICRWTCGLQPVRREDGTLLGICGAITPHSGRGAVVRPDVAAPKAPLADDGWLSSIADVAPYGIVVLRRLSRRDGAADPDDFRCLFANARAANFLDLSKDNLALLHRPPPPLGDWSVLRRCAEVLGSGRGRDIMLAHKTAEGCGWYLYTIKPHGRGVVVFMTDVSGHYPSCGMSADMVPDGVVIVSESDPIRSADFISAAGAGWSASENQVRPL